VFGKFVRNTVDEKIRKRHVVLIAGRDKGRRGAVIEVLADDGARRRINMPRSQRPNPQMASRAESSSAKRRCTSRRIDLQSSDSKGRPGGIQGAEDGRKSRVFK